MARSKSRPKLNLPPISPVTVVTIVGAIVLMIFVKPLAGEQKWAYLLWGLPAIVVFVQPFASWIRGHNDTLNVGVREIPLTGLRKVVLCRTRTYGMNHPSAVLVFRDGAEHITGLFHMAGHMERLAMWCGTPIERLPGVWPMTRLVAERPELQPRVKD